MTGRHPSGPNAMEDRSACIRQRNSQAYEHRLILQRWATSLLFCLGILPDAYVSLFVMHMHGDKNNKQHLSYFGVRLNLRETERKRRKKVDDPMSVSTVSAGAGGSGSGPTKGKRRDDEESGYED